MIDKTKLIGRYAITLFPLYGGNKVYVWAAVQIGHYRDSTTFPSSYKINLNPIAPFIGKVDKDSFYTNDLTFKDLKEINTTLAQPEEWAPVYIVGNNAGLAEVWAKALNNNRQKQGLIPEDLPEDIKKDLGEIGCLKFLY